MAEEKVQGQKMTLEDLHWDKRYDQLALWPIDKALWPYIDKSKPLSEQKVKTRIARLLPLAKSELSGKDYAGLETIHWSNPLLDGTCNVSKYLGWCRLDFIARMTHWYGVEEPNWFSLGYVWSDVIEQKRGVYGIHDLCHMKDFELRNKQIPTDISALAYYLFRLGGFHLAFLKLYSSSAADYLEYYDAMFDVQYPFGTTKYETPEIESTDFVSLFQQNIQTSIQKEFDENKLIYNGNIAPLYNKYSAC